MHRVRLLISALGALLPTPGTAQATPPNVIIVMTDDQGYGDLGCHGNPVIQTPHLDAMAAESVRFGDFHVAPMCTPTRGQLMTGVDALRNGAMNVSSGRALLRRDYPTMAEVLRAAGYLTGIFGKWHLGDNYPFRAQDRGFAESVCFQSSYINAVPNHWDSDYFDDVYLHNGRKREYQGYTTDVFFREAMAWMKACKRDGKPFFCYLPTAAPHGPLFVPAKYREAAAARLAARLPDLKLSPARRQALARFLGMIENIDANFGRLEGFLRAEGLRDNTILVFLTDNGSTMGPRYYNAGMKGRKVTLWEGGHRVPLFVRWPAGRLGKAREVRKLTQVQDLLPTLMELCGVERRAGHEMDGMSLVPLLRGTGEDFPDRTLVVHYSRMPFRVQRRKPVGPSIPTRQGAAVMWKRWRLLEDKALYDLAADPRQERNVIAAHPKIAAAMREHFDGWWRQVEARLQEPVRIIIGADAENPSRLTACDWFDVFVDQQRQVRRADAKFGAWHLQVARAGQYEIELRRWPKEAGLAIAQGIPATKVRDGTFVKGRPIPVAQARLQVGRHDETVDVAAGAKVVRFVVDLPAGPLRMQSWFLDAKGGEITGAYYARVRRR